MRSFQRILVVCVCLAGLATNSLASYTFEPTRAEPQILRWKEMAIRLAISDSLGERNPGVKFDSDVSGAIRRSLSHWQKIVGIDFILESSPVRNVSASGPAGDGVSLITIAASPENVLLFAKDPFSESARTRVFYDRKGFITEADIVLNPYQQFSTDGTLGTFDLEATLTHEIGHLLGLRHSSVLGSVMSEGIARNSSVRVAESPQTALADADIAAIRELYGYEDDDGTCCAAVSGRLAQSAARSQRALRIWAEDNDTGRVAAQSESKSDGSFRLGGLPPGLYSVFWQSVENDDPSPVGLLGMVRLSAGDNKQLNEKIAPLRTNLGLSFIGMNDQLADSAITLTADREYTVLLGGKALEHQRLKIEFNSPYFRALPGSVKRYDLGTELSAVSFILAIDANAPDGLYSLFLTSDDGIMAALVGGLRVVAGKRTSSEGGLAK